MAPKVRFADGEKVLCFHGPLLYEAKCMKWQLKDKTVRHLIHYSGWNKNWDEWVPESRVLKYNDANMQRQKDLQAAHNEAKKIKGGKGSKKGISDRESTALPPQEKTPKQKSKDAAAASVAPESQAELQRKKRSRTEQNVETEEEYIQKLEIKVKIPDELKCRLVDDWILINHEEKLVQLPARIPVDTIIADYIKQRLSVKGMTPNKETVIIESTDGIREYFNTMLGRRLLYNAEKSQYNELLAENPEMIPSQIYGAIHLLRLFTKIGSAMAYTQMDEDSVPIITSLFYDFQKFMAKSAATLFSQSNYIPTPSKCKKEVN
ncbi:mortality factor 4-like protein 1 [Trichonephila inaurata madagascariensis]|uniref:Mortality factor 4-like protein 1 n=1 Tax=Trichonephila inaurata madagascariensis TaxID=2747483 RepID=A0A8X6WP38_9ARAC|nr:mortality factor 4-like protein 1 [Trichonephila inaurata madagascariensis]